MSDGLYLGFDCSTQSMTAVVVDAEGNLVRELNFSFDQRLPQYKTVNGVVRPERDANEVEIPSLLFVDALDEMLADLAKDPNVDVSKIRAVSGSAQQHASVYWSKEFSLPNALNTAQGNERLVNALRKQSEPFYLERGPSWMDSSTTRFCKDLEKYVGGPDQVAAISGSRAYERFTGNQIAKRVEEYPDFFDKVGRVALVSSMLTSLLAGEYTAIDESDGSGMNLYDVRKQEYSPELLKGVAKYSKDPNAVDKLKTALGDNATHSYTTVGTIHPYYQKKFSFAPDCRVIPFSGDNPCSLAGIGLSETGDVGISLGTSTTVMAVVPTNDARFSGKEGHFFRNPIDPHSLMAMICYKNGALTREEVKNRRVQDSWEHFGSVLKQTPIGNNGTFGFYYTDAEITPPTARGGIIGFDANDKRIDLSQAPAETEVRAVVEGQILSLRLHAEMLGVRDPQRLIVVGGASANREISEVLANVFNAPVYTLPAVANSAALGGAFRARHGYRCAESNESWVHFQVGKSLNLQLAAEPAQAAAEAYTKLLPRFQQLEQLAVQELST